MSANLILQLLVEDLQEHIRNHSFRGTIPFNIIIYKRTYVEKNLNKLGIRYGISPFHISGICVL